MKNIILILTMIFSSYCLANNSPISNSLTMAEDFAKLSKFSTPQLSPDGKSVAYIMLHEGKPVLITKSLNKNTKIKPGALPMNGAHLQWFRWANNERLIVAIRISGEPPSITTQRFRVKYHQDRYSFVRLFSIDRSGLNPVYFDMERNEWGLALSHPDLISIMQDDPKHVLLTLDPARDTQWKPQVHKVNIYTGKKTLVEGNRGKYNGFVADAKGNIKLAYKHGVGKGTDIAFYTREENSDPWRVWQKKNFINENAYWPYRFDYNDSNILLVYPNDKRKKNCDEDSLGLKKLNISTGQLEGDHTDSYRKNAKALIEKNIPNTKACLASWTNDVTLDKTIYSFYSDTEPSKFVIYDIKNKRIDFLGDSYPHLKGYSLSKMYETQYKARDGLTIPALLSLPAQLDKGQKVDKPLPTIIFPHGGPWARDHWGFNNYVQFFTQKGYAVLQPQFRGSVGFGHDFFKAGTAQWGLKIQDDITDGLKWMINQGYTDPKKVCIVGASFGGYAAGIGMTLTPDLYRCGISINGVLNMKKFMVEVVRNNEYNEELTNSEWGINKVSPYHNIKKIKGPLMLIYGDNDSVVNREHSIDMHKKMIKKGKNSELVLLPGGEHWRTIESNEIKIFKAMDQFLSNHLD